MTIENFLRTGDSEELPCSPAHDGSVILPKEIEEKLRAHLEKVSPMRRLASKRIASSVHSVAVRTGAGDAFSMGELYAMPASTGSQLKDLTLDMGDWLALETKDVFSAQENSAFINGDGVAKPKGVLTYGDKLHSETAPEELSADDLMTLIYSLSAKDRSQGSFIMNRRTLNDLRKIKDADGNYIWQPSAEQGSPSSLLGYPLEEFEDMPDIAPGATPIVFGNFRDGYEIIDKQGVRVLRDPYSAKPYVLFYTTMKVGGGIKDINAFAALKIGEKQNGI